MQENLVVKKATPLGARVWTSLLVFGFIGQIAWMVENVYFSTYIQKNITAAGWATSATVAASAIAAALATIFSAAWSDRVGKRRAFVCWGYILWGITTAAFALFGNGQVGGDVGLAVTLFVVMDCIMSAIGSTANDSAFSAWVTDVTDVTNRGVVDIVLSIMPILALIVIFAGFDGDRARQLDGLFPRARRPDERGRRARPVHLPRQSGPASRAGRHVPARRALRFPPG